METEDYFYLLQKIGELTIRVENLEKELEYLSGEQKDNNSDIRQNRWTVE